MTVNSTIAQSAFEFPYVVSDNQLKTSAILNCILGAASLLAFIAVRGTLRSVGGVYQRRRELADLFLQPPQLLLGGLQQAWSWATAVMCMSDTDIVRTAGFDALMLNRTILMGLQMFTVLTLLGVGILLPTYLKFDDIVTHRVHRTNVAELSRSTISNLPPGHAILWLPTVATYVVVGYCCWVLLVHCQSYAELRMAYMLCLDAAGAQHYQERKTPRSRGGSRGTRFHRPGSSGSWTATATSRPWGHNSASGSRLDRGASGADIHQQAGANGSVGGGGGGAVPAAGISATAAAAAAASLPGSALGSCASLQGLLPPDAGASGPLPSGNFSFHPSWGVEAAAPNAPGLGAAPVPGVAASRLARDSHGPLLVQQGGSFIQLHRPQDALGGAAALSGGGGLQAAAAASGAMAVAVSVGPTAQRTAGLAHVSYDPVGVAARAGGRASGPGAGRPAAAGAAAAAAAGGAGAPLAPNAQGEMSLRVRLRLVAPWLRHVVVSAAERATRHKAADNLLAWLSPVKMLAKDREDWARQQLAADADADPMLPPVPSGRPPGATAADGGLLVASETMIMALTGRAEDVREPALWPGGRAVPVEWSEGVRELARSMGILLGPSGERPGGGGEKGGGDGPAATRGAAGTGAAGPGEGGTVGGDRAAAAGGNAPEKLREAGTAAEGTCTRALGGGKGGQADSAQQQQPQPRGPAQAASGAAPGVAPAVAVGPKDGAGSAQGDSGGSGKSCLVPPVYRYWAPAAEQRCFCRSLRRRQARQAPWHPPGTPMGFAATLNPAYDLSAAPTAACSAGGSLNMSAGGAAGGGLAAAGGRPFGGNLWFLPPGLQGVVAAGKGPGKGSAGGGDGGGAAAAVGGAQSSGGGAGPSWQRPPHAMLQGGDGGSSEEEDEDEDDDDDGGDGSRPWTGWQQQPLVAGRCNARLRQLMKVRCGGRSHLVNCHHYAVLVRDVVLRPVERFNLIGLPVLRSSVDEGAAAAAAAAAGRGQGAGLGSGYWEPSDIESGGGGGHAGSHVGAGQGRGSQSGTGPANAPVSGGTWKGADEEEARKGRGGSGGSGSDDGSGGGGGSGAEGSGSEHNPLLSGAEEADTGSEGEDGGGASQPRRRRMRPLLQPTSDLPLRDRAAHLVRELRGGAHRHRAGQGARQHRAQPAAAPGPGPAPETGPGRASADHLPGKAPAAAGMVVELASHPTSSSAAAAARRSDGGGGAGGRSDEAPLLGPFAVHRSDHLLVADHLVHSGGTAEPLPAPPPPPHPHQPHQQLPPCPLGDGKPQPPAATEELHLKAPPAAAGSGSAATAVHALTAAAGAGITAVQARGSCSGAVPAPPPLMELPYDDSEEAAAVAAYYTQLFPDSFQRLVPVCNHRAVDELLFQWTSAMGTLAAALLAAHVAVRSAASASSPLSSSASPRAASVPVPVAAAATPASPIKGRRGLDAPTSCCASPSPRTAAGPSGTSSPTAAAAAAEPSPPNGAPLPAPVDLPPLSSGHVKAIRRAAAAVRRLQDQIAVARACALRTPTRRAYIALFTCQRDAAAAAQCSPLAPPSRAQPLHFRAPSPDSVYWPALWTLPTGRAARLLASAPLLAVLVFPIGVLTGALANLPVAVCGGTPQLNALYWPWFCNRQHAHTLTARVAKSLLTGLLPALISLGWNAWVLPMVLYLLSAIQSRCVSLPAMDRQMSRWFFWWSLLNMFLGAVVGGGIFQQLGAYLQDPGKLLLRIGTALPTASNFFMHYTLTKGLYSNWLRVVWPHLGCMAGAMLRSLAGAALPRSWQDVFLIHSPPGYRFSSFYNGVFQTLMVGLAYAVTAPLIAPIALLFFLTAYITWRYAIVYVYERQYESGGQMFPVVFSHLTGYLLMSELFTGAVLLTNGAWIQAALLWCSLTPAIMAFHHLCQRRYLRPLEHPPLSLAMASPAASVDASVYLPPALREGSLGWYPESGKVWEQYGIPKYVI